MPGGVNSPVRAFGNVNSTPIFIKSASGAYLHDVDGNDYVDFIGSWGPMILGHSNPKIIKAIKDQADLGTSYGAPTEAETSIGELIRTVMPSIEKIRMVNSGTEATMSCIRLARGYTGRNKIIKFTGCYHGHVDSLLIKAGSGVSTFGLPDSPGIPEELARHTISVPYNDINAFLEVFESIKSELAAVIIEPIAGNMGFIPGDKDFLETLRTKTHESGSVLIFDEVMTGFRVSLGGAQELYGITPDLTALGKVIGGGLPVGAFGGKAEIMNFLAPEGPVYQAGTLSGNPLAVAAGKCLINELIKTNPYDELEANASYLLTNIKNEMFKKEIPFSFNQIGGMFGFFFTDEFPNNFDDVSATSDKYFESFFKDCLNQGIYFAPSKYEAGFISTKHTKKILDEVINKVKVIYGT
ncbi:MAG: glutamate-1-semialdehyde 2,1-aminomutase [Gammaproteobacteria bacterium]|nr:MAG: glutamate-1-semialdehyde 2,1-aminomutase [Gammaproteobacteria bacterium]